MTTLIVGGAMFAGIMFFIGKGKNSPESHIEEYYKHAKMEQEIQQMKDRVWSQTF